MVAVVHGIKSLYEFYVASTFLTIWCFWVLTHITQTMIF